MRLTVGPLPAAVYWRRRALVIGLLALVVVLVSYACGGAGAPADAGRHTPTPTGTRPTTQGAIELSPSPTSATPSQPAFSLPTTAVTGPCADAEMSVAATAPSGTAARLTVVPLTITFRNVSTRTCTRDIGADMQELRLMSGKELVWSSDDCNPNHGRDPYAFAPNAERQFKLNWNGRISRSGTGAVTCATTAPAPPIGAYELYGRLATKLSPPFTLRIT
jgi:hypothetical protein